MELMELVQGSVEDAAEMIMRADPELIHGSQPTHELTHGVLAPSDLVALRKSIIDRYDAAGPNSYPNLNLNPNPN